MTKTRQDGDTEDAKGRAKRSYNSPLREQQSRETRDRIVAAGAELVHEFHAWDWTNLTARAVGERAGVSERAVQSDFPTELQLRDAVLQRLVDESGVNLDALELGDFSGVIESMFTYLSSFAIKPETVADPSFASMDKYRRDMLLGAVERAMPDWQAEDRTSVAAMLDIFWNPLLYERLVEAWDMSPDQAVKVITWLVRLVEEAAYDNRHP